MVNLDDISVYQRFDKSHMLDHLHGFPEQCRKAWQDVLKFDLPREYSGISDIVIVGMGGSAIGGDVACRLVLAESKVPVFVHRDYGLPAFVGDGTLVIVSSYSGNTEETLSAFAELLKTGARKLVITSGGQLQQLAQNRGIPVFLVDYRATPRAVFPYSLISLIGISQKLGVIRDRSADMQEATGVLNRLSNELTETSSVKFNEAKRLAAKLWGRVAVIYGAEILSEVARRWKGQFNENSKAWAFFESFPELDHNAVDGYRFPIETKERIFAVMLRSSSFRARTLLRYEATASLLSGAGIPYGFVESRGECALAQVLSAVLLGDYVSFYLAMLNEVDPTPTGGIDFVKEYLARSTTSSDQGKSEKA